MDLEFAILDFIRDNLTSPFMDSLMKGISFLGNAGWIWIVIGVILAVMPKTRRIGMTVCISLLFSLILCNLTLKPLIARVRPYDLVDGIELLISTPIDYSFPSGHTSASFAAAASIFAYDKKWGAGALTLAVLIAFSRLYLYVHFPSDVLGGMILGSLCAIMAYFVLKLLYKRMEI